MVSHEDVMVFPSKLFRNNFGLGMDFGSSQVKATYTSRNGEDLNVHFVSFPKEKYHEAFCYLRDKCAGQLISGAKVHTCGIGVSTYTEKLENMLNIRVENTSEMDRMMDGFMFLMRNLSRDSCIHPPCDEARRQGAALAKGLVELWPIMNPGGRFKVWDYLGEEHEQLPVPGPDGTCIVQYPVIVALVGSRASIWQGFEELVTLAEKGDPNNVDQMLSVLGAGNQDGVYKVCNELHAKCFAFGNTANKTIDDVEPADAAAATLSLVAQSSVQDAVMAAMISGIKQVFFVGGFAPSCASIRNVMEKEFAFKSYANFKNHPCACHFIRNGSHAAAFGTLLKNLQVI